jgi:hypothetical protein
MRTFAFIRTVAALLPSEEGPRLVPVCAVDPDEPCSNGTQHPEWYAQIASLGRKICWGAEIRTMIFRIRKSAKYATMKWKVSTGCRCLSVSRI